MHERPRKRGWVFCLAFAAIAVSGAYLWSKLHSGIEVSIANPGTTMRSVVLHVTGRSYPVGDILPGKIAVATVQPTSESHLEIELTDAQGQRRRLNADVYFEPGYSGTVSVVIQDGKIVSSEYRETGVAARRADPAGGSTIDGAVDAGRGRGPRS
jgi:hypothetical protein